MTQKGLPVLKTGIAGIFACALVNLSAGFYHGWKAKEGQ